MSGSYADARPLGESDEATRGVLFERVIAPSSWTKTSMASIMTAQSPDGHGVRGINDRLPDDRVTLSERFSEGGFYTIGVHANPWLRDKFGFGRGFDVYRSMKFHTSGFELNREALRAIAEAPHDRPIFVYLHYMDVHAPYTPGTDFFRAESIALPDGTVLADLCTQGYHSNPSCAGRSLCYNQGERRRPQGPARALGRV